MRGLVALIRVKLRSFVSAHVKVVSNFNGKDGVDATGMQVEGTRCRRGWSRYSVKGGGCRILLGRDGLRWLVRWVNGGKEGRNGDVIVSPLRSKLSSLASREIKI